MRISESVGRDTAGRSRWAGSIARTIETDIFITTRHSGVRAVPQMDLLESIDYANL